MSRRRERALLCALLLVGAWVRFGALGADLPVELGLTHAPVQDAAWYVETAARRAEGVALEPEASPWDVRAWTTLASAWFQAWGAGPRSSHALGALISLLTVLALWRFLRPFGPKAALGGAAVLAVLYPTVLLGRSALVYGPAALFLLTCAAVWRHGHRHRGAGRIAFELAAWLLLLLGCWSLRPPLAALAGGLFAGHLTRSKHPGRWALVGLGLTLLGLGLALALPGLRQVSAIDAFAYRLELHGFTTDLGSIASDALRVAGNPQVASSRHGSGFARLALIPLVVAAWGWTLAVQSKPRLSSHALEVVALLGGWLAGFYLANLPFSARPLRYWALIGPPLAGLAGLGLALPRRPRPLGLGELAAISVPSAILGAHVLPAGLEYGGVNGGFLAIGAGAVLAVGVCSVLATTGPSLRSMRLRPLAVAVVLCVPFLRCAELVIRPSHWTEVSREALAELLHSDAVLCGPFAPVLTQGTGRNRRLGYTLRTDLTPDKKERLPAGLAWAREAGVTHIALELGQEQSSQLRYHCARLGAPLTLVAILHVGGPPEDDRRRQRVRGAAVLLLRFPWTDALSSVETGTRPKLGGALFARAAGLCARGEADTVWRWLKTAHPSAQGELEAIIRRTPRLPNDR